MPDYAEWLQNFRKPMGKSWDRTANGHGPHPSATIMDLSGFVERIAHQRCVMNGLSDFDLLTLADVAKLLHCSKAHVSKAVAGRVRGCPPIPAVSLGRRKVVRRETLLAWIERNEQAASGVTMGASPVRGAGKRA